MKSLIGFCRHHAYLAVVSILLNLSTNWDREILSAEPPRRPAEAAKRKASLETILKLLPPDRTQNGRVSFYDKTFKDWQSRTGELPPDFDQMPSIPFLPDPLVLDEGATNVPVVNRVQWKEKRAWMKRQLEHYITGTYPPRPHNLKAQVLEAKREGETIIRLVELRFGPEHWAKLTVELMIPPDKGPFPVCMTQWNHREWALVAVRRGYVGCVYAGADAKDDTEGYAEIWAGEYDFTRLMRRAFGAFRAIDYLYTLSFIDKDKIGFTGHSRNGDLAFIAAAFDERVTAVIPSSGTGMEVPWRYSTNKYDIEDIALLTCGQPSWFHPRLRFFIGREHKLPIDQHHFMALIAPRGRLLSCAINERHGNPWASEQVYFSTRKVYRFLGADENLAIRLRYGLHSISARDMEDYIDFFDYVFKRGGRKPDPRLFYDYSFEKWRKRSGEQVNPQNCPVRNLDDLLTDGNNNRIDFVNGWEQKKAGIMLGFGNRIEEGTRFYQRYPHWSKMGKMVLDVRAALDALANLDCVEHKRILVAGYSLGATVGLYSAALDERIAGVVSIAGITPMRTNTAERGTEGIRAYSHLHGLLPRLGFFVGEEPRVPDDFHEILACIAPRPVLVVAPTLDKDAPVQDVQYCVEQARKVYDLYDADDKIQVFSPDDYNRLSDEMLEKTYLWLQDGPGL